MSIKAALREIESISIEITRNNARNAELRKRLKQLNTKVTEYMEEKDLPGVTYDGKAVIIKTKTKQPAKGKKDKKVCVIQLLSQLGIRDTEDAYKKLTEIQKKEPVEVKEVKIGILTKTGDVKKERASKKK